MSPSPRDDRVRVLVVDDSPSVRRLVGRLLEDDPGIVVCGTACSGEEALDMVAELRPDVMTLDVMMPGMDGLTVLEQLMANDPLPVLMLSSLTGQGAVTSVRALEAGAVDVLEKPPVMTWEGEPPLARELVAKVKAASRIDVARLLRRRPPEQRPRAFSSCPRVTPAVTVIGASTGGPGALRTLLSSLDPAYPSPIVLVQHMPTGFTAALAERLDALTPLEVREASDGDELRPGRIIVGRAGSQLHLEKRRHGITVRVDGQPAGLRHKPSIDVVMRSAAEAFGMETLGILLTGMGEDGAAGLLAVRHGGGRTIAEAESSAVIFGMPKAAIALGAATDVLDLHDILHTLNSYVHLGRVPAAG
jgi:two-component system, chemotaxis family, protein-glutamate methylesterase/glutaminase